MSFVNVGAFIDGRNAETKKVLREALANAPATVTFYATAMAEVEQIKGDELPERLAGGDKLTVVGPDPYHDRRWYAQVSLNTKNKITIK